jgi:5-methylcytosine-specific restriction endonuclease McrA
MTGGGCSANPRYANGHRRRQLRARLKAEGNPCHICGGAIDYTLPAGHPLSFEVDEVVPIARGGDPLCYENCKASHRICNERKGARQSWTAKRKPTALTTSREW